MVLIQQNYVSSFDRPLRFNLPLAIGLSFLAYARASLAIPTFCFHNLHRVVLILIVLALATYSYIIGHFSVSRPSFSVKC